METLKILSEAVEQGASDIFLIPGMPYAYKVSGYIREQNDIRLSPEALKSLAAQIYEFADNRSMQRLAETGDDDFSFSIKGLSRFRANIFKQRGSYAVVLRIVNYNLPDYAQLRIPDAVMRIADMYKGLVLVTGPAGSGKSTTLSCIIDKINNTRNAHIITLEDPIEFLLKHKKSIVTQREISIDTANYGSALRASLRQAPDVILLGELRDYETIQTAMTAAETGHLVISTLHTIGASTTVDRIIDNFPQNQQNQIKLQLSMVLQAVVSQLLIPTIDSKITPAFEIMFLNGAIRNMIRESKNHQIDSVILSGKEQGMITMDNSLMEIYKEGRITKETLLTYSTNREIMEKKLERA